jgi:hypothetical protein
MFDPDAFADHLRALDPRIVVRSGNCATEAFPLRLWQTYELGGDEARVDFTLSVFNSPDGKKFTADLVTETGAFLAEYDTRTLSHVPPDADNVKAVRDWMDGIEDFLRREANAIVRHLADAAQKTGIGR